MSDEIEDLKRQIEEAKDQLCSVDEYAQRDDYFQIQIAIQEMEDELEKLKCM